jgi:hypothetical protein
MMNYKPQLVLEDLRQAEPIIDNRPDLYDLLETLDQLHSQASEGEATHATGMNRNELVALLQDIVYTAQETLQELSNHETPRKPILRIVEKMEKIS